MNPQVSILITKPNYINNLILESSEIKDNVELLVSAIFWDLINSHYFSEIELFHSIKFRLEKIYFAIKERTVLEFDVPHPCGFLEDESIIRKKAPDGINIQNIIWDLSINDMVVTMSYTIKMFYGEDIIGTIKKCICRIPKDDSYLNLFKEMGVNDESIDVAIMSAKLKIQEQLKKSII